MEAATYVVDQGRANHYYVRSRHSLYGVLRACNEPLHPLLNYVLALFKGVDTGVALSKHGVVALDTVVRRC